MVPALAATPLGHDQPGLFEYAQMLHDGAAIDRRQQVAQHAGGARLVLEQIEDLAANAVAQRLENPVILVVG
ncbi:hypothetical protein D3C78_1948300 [compost metagenome]